MFISMYVGGCGISRYLVGNHDNYCTGSLCCFCFPMVSFFTSLSCDNNGQQTNCDIIHMRGVQDGSMRRADNLQGVLQWQVCHSDKTPVNLRIIRIERQALANTNILFTHCICSKWYEYKQTAEEFKVFLSLTQIDMLNII